MTCGEPWMRGADQILDDEQLIEQVFEAQGRRWQTPSEIVLRLLILKHVRNWSYQTLEREVRANLVYRAFATGRRTEFGGPRLLASTNTHHCLPVRESSLPEESMVVRSQMMTCHSGGHLACG
jgi:hypothetical protein